jgi:hypothetical protein
MRISRKTKWVSTSGWRGYSEPVNAAAGANDTGTWDDSPCPSGTATRELDEYKKRLRKEKIPFTEMNCETSNVFCVNRYVLVPDEHLVRAADIAEEMSHDTSLLYPVRH